MSLPNEPTIGYSERLKEMALSSYVVPLGGAALLMLAFTLSFAWYDGVRGESPSYSRGHVAISVERARARQGSEEAGSATGRASRGLICLDCPGQVFRVDPEGAFELAHVVEDASRLR